MPAKSTDESAVELGGGRSARLDDDNDVDLRALGDNCVSVRDWMDAGQLICRQEVVGCCDDPSVTRPACG